MSEHVGLNELCIVIFRLVKNNSDKRNTLRNVSRQYYNDIL